jgi:hypothetical protein
MSTDILGEIICDVLNVNVDNKFPNPKIARMRQLRRIRSEGANLAAFRINP